MFIINSQFTHTETNTHIQTHRYHKYAAQIQNTHTCKYLAFNSSISFTLKSASATDLNKVQRTFVAIDLSGP